VVLGFTIARWKIAGIDLIADHWRLLELDPVLLDG